MMSSVKWLLGGKDSKKEKDKVIHETIAARRARAKERAQAKAKAFKEFHRDEKEHPVMISVVDNYVEYSYLLKNADGALDVFGETDKTQDPSMRENLWDSDFEEESATDGNNALTVNPSSGRGTLKAFHKATHTGGRGGIRTEFHQLSGQVHAAVVRLPQNQSYFYGSFEQSAKLSTCIPILIVSDDMTEESVRAILREKPVQPTPFKYMNYNQVNELKPKEREKYDAELKAFNELNSAYYRVNGAQTYWSPLFKKVDEWKKDGEEVMLNFVKSADLEKGKEWLRQSLVKSLASHHQEKTLPNRFLNLLLPA